MSARLDKTTLYEWRHFEGSELQWDELIEQSTFATPFQTSKWGRYRARFGWQSLKLISLQKEKPVAMVQVLVRRVLPFVSIAWIPGGLTGNLDACNDNLRVLIRRSLGTPFFVIRMNLQRLRDSDESRTMNSLDWQLSTHKMLSDISLRYDLTDTDEAREAQLTKNWRHNLRRSFKRDITAYHWVNPNPAEMKVVYDQMHSYKGIEHLAHHNTLESISSLITQFGDDCIVVRCDDSAGNIIAMRGALVIGNQAWDTFAAATPVGRKTYASYKAFWELMRLCKERGVVTYDMGGADPINNRGVYDFKHGTGATVVRFLGEWEYSRPRLLGLIAGRRIAARLR